MAYGDSFGGVQAAAQAQDRSRSSDYFNQLQAQRAAEALNLNALQADRSYGLQMRQLNDAAQAREDARRMREQEQAAGDARYGLEYLTNLGNTAFNRDTTLENQALNREQFDLNKEAQAQKLLNGVDQIHNQGAALADQLGEATTRRAEAAKALGEVERQGALLNQFFAQKRISKDEFATKMAGLKDVAMGAKRDMSMADSGFKKATSQAMNLGFVPSNGKLVHARTGKEFSYQIQDILTPDTAQTYEQPGGSPDSQPVMPINRIQNPAASVSPGYLARAMSVAKAFMPQPQPRTIDVQAQVSPSFDDVSETVQTPQATVTSTEGLVPLDQRFNPSSNVGVLEYLGRLAQSGDEAALGRLDVARQQYPNAQLVKRGGDVIQTFQGQQRRPTQYFIDVGQRNTPTPVQPAAPTVPRFAPAPPMQERVTGAVYVTPRGPMRWIGNGWTPIQ